ncbi:hypothetical protein PCANC_09604 [Puccinia coronata f. sp. avenae]|uniref:Integrase catalytic domain-containing protein n=1 Tax=Puccinia coronata f. sp. avenae TaxID=200324 RepID=A0A2N5V9S1_9BASI|nr:hypothetical protein PCANC_09604 [Puccinia coronata f. sp. avenae]
MKKLITDGGGEFCNHTLAEILANEGIQHNVAPLYTPHHNVKLFLKTSPLLDFLKPFGCQAWSLKAKAVRDAKFDSIAWKEVFPTRLPLSKSLNVLPDDASQFAPVFNIDPVLPYEDSPDVGQDSHEKPQEESPVENYPISPESGRRWIYVPDFQPPENITSDISASNIVTGKRNRPQACFIATSVDPKSHAMAMRSVDSDHWKKAEAKEIQNMIDHDVWIVCQCTDDDKPIASTWAYR